MKQVFLDIPELVTHLAPYLSPADLLSCVQLNSAWSKTFVPFLWRSIDDSTHSWGDILLQITSPRPQPQSPAATTETTATEGATGTAPDNTPFGVCALDISRHRDSDCNKDRDWLLAIFEKYGHHIRELKIQSPMILEAASRNETCTGLHTLVLGLNADVSGPRTEYLPHPPAPPQMPQLAMLPGLGTLNTPPVVGGLVANALSPSVVADGLGATPAPSFGGFGATPAGTPEGFIAPIAAPAAPAVFGEIGTDPTAAALGGFGTASALAPAAAVAGFGAAPTAATVSGFGAAAPVALAVEPAAAFGGFGVATAAVAAHGFGATSVGRVADPYQEPDVELSDPLFPDHLTLADFKTTKRHERVTPESDKARKEYVWTLAQHTWHLIRTNPGLVRFDTSKSCRLHDTRISADFTFATFRLLKHLKDLNGNEHLFKNLHFWRLWDALPAKIESLSIIGPIYLLHVFPLPDPLPEVNTSLKVLQTEGDTTVNELLTLLGIFPNLTRLRLQKVEENPRYMSSPNYTPLPPPPFGGQYLRRLEGTVQDWDTVLQYIPSIVEWESQGERLKEDLALFLKDRCPNLESLKQKYQPWFINERHLAGIRGNDPTNQFLITHRHLREFDSIENFIKVDEMLREPWTCMGLEWLTCRIVGFDRLTPEEEEVAARVMAPGYSTELSVEEIGVVEKFNRCRTQHHGVYDRLASLTRLKHLDLGYENRYPWEYKSGEIYVGRDGEEYLTYDPPTFDTLELTLESGLGRLGALKNLEMFGFECINHKIGKAELEWMAKSWPKLNLMYGLDHERLYKFEHDKDRAALREYFSTLRPDVVHDSLFQDDF